MLNAIKERTGYRNSWLNMLKTVSLPYFNTLDPYLTGEDDSMYQKRIWALASAMFKCLLCGAKTFLYWGNTNGMKVKVTFPLNLEIMGNIFIWMYFSISYAFSLSRFSHWYHGCAQEQT
jgi:hypothetical protein